MATRIEVEHLGGDEFQVRIVETKSQSLHRVTLKQSDHQRLTEGKIPPAELIRLSFEFLLENEPKESILSRFDLPMIGRYFPDFDREIKHRIVRKS